ncbi:hypothetical protein LNQ49_06420 [Flavobacterium sp. F-65]|uniref:Uncharacterized protein n=1 Tax=Flavobacterium pisciphilum TaxID=2893755 RepID=A0ABS8MR44_9FLAO|nr:hypothetical protein [Flavobacterium sp. F-65]MCC9071227.1 hypothetical protein [Flavobacterium sp. F-65]
MFKTVAHQTLENRNNDEYVEANGPFSVQNIKESFLGEGCYFWDNHLELAKFWGEVHCNNKYIVCESKFVLPKNDFLDLVGSREDQIHFLDLVEKLKMTGEALGKIIGALKDLELKKKGIFPYKAIRAVDNLAKNKFEQVKYKFSDDNNKKNYSILTPMYIICLFEKNELILPTYDVIYSV